VDGENGCPLDALCPAVRDGAKKLQERCKRPPVLQSCQETGVSRSGFAALTEPRWPWIDGEVNASRA
jgi:hypothetical protein